MSLHNLSIGKRLALVLGLILSFSLVSSLFAVQQLRAMVGEVQRMIDDELKAERLASDWHAKTYGSVQRATAIARSTDPALSSYFAPINTDAARQINAIQQKLEALADSPQETALLSQIAEVRKRCLSALESIYKLQKAGDAKGSLQVFTLQFEPGSRDYLGAVQKMADLQRHKLDESAARVDTLGAQTRWMLIVCAVSALGLSVLLAWYVSRSITQPLREAETMASAIAAMDLSGQRRDHHHRDETGRLLRALDEMRAALRQALGQVREVADSVSTASSQIATGNADLSARTEHAAANLQETAGAMEQLTGTVRNTADSAHTAGELASTARDAAAQGGEVVRHVISTMGDISEGSRRIGDIVGLIDSIAFQTNILALNAAVEAARAGDQGRGFAVVATEVRTLAGRSAEAAREIKALIGSSMEQVEAGRRLVEQAGSAMGHIVVSVRRVTDIIEAIDAASREQSQGIGEVNTAVVQLDQMTQQNAALVEASSAAADSLRDQACRLTEVVNGFRLS